MEELILVIIKINFLSVLISKFIVKGVEERDFYTFFFSF